MKEREKLPVWISHKSKGESLKPGATVQDVIDLMGHPTSHGNDGVEAFLGYNFETHEISFEFDTHQDDQNITFLKNCEVWIHHKLPMVNSYSVSTLNEKGQIKAIETGLSKADATAMMTKLNHSTEPASHWIHHSRALVDKPTVISTSKTINIDGNKIKNWESFHDTFYKEMNFPGYYGRNMDAWIDCVSEIAGDNGLLRINITGMKRLKKICPEIYEAINECSAFVNYRFFEKGVQAALALTYDE